MKRPRSIERLTMRRDRMHMAHNVNNWRLKIDCAYVFLYIADPIDLCIAIIIIIIISKFRLYLRFDQ